MSALTKKIERRLVRDAGLRLTVEEDGESVVISGMVDSTELKRAALEIAVEEVSGRSINDGIEIADTLPMEFGAAEFSEVEVGMFEGAAPGLSEDEALTPGDFTDQKTIVGAQDASGPSGAGDDMVSEGDYVYVPPIDPVRDGWEVIGGFQSDSLESVEVERSALDGLPGDEALADAVRRELREDSTTTALNIQVEVRNGVVHLHGTVDDLEDVENAEAVASVVPGIVEVREELEIAGM